MAATAEQIAKLRRMTAEPTEATYTDEAMAEYIEAHPLNDPAGNEPTIEFTGNNFPYLDNLPITDLGKMVANPLWTATYDLNAAAADVWEEKANLSTDNFDFSADGASFSRSQAHDHAVARAKFYRSRRAPKMVHIQPQPKPPVEGYLP